MTVFKLTLGDPSGDGHKVTDTVLFETDVSLDKIREAYAASCRLTKIQFHSGSNLTGEKYDWQTIDEFSVCTEYEVHGLTKTCIKILAQFGITKIEDADYLGAEDFAKLLIAFIKLSAPDVHLELVTDEMPEFNAQGSSLGNVNFGYGLFE